jgi:hypothetical protein
MTEIFCLDELQLIAPMANSPYSDKQLDCNGRACANCGNCRDWYWTPGNDKKVYKKRGDAVCTHPLGQVAVHRCGGVHDVNSNCRNPCHAFLCFPCNVLYIFGYCFGLCGVDCCPGYFHGARGSRLCECEDNNS